MLSNLPPHSESNFENHEDTKKPANGVSSSQNPTRKQKKTKVADTSVLSYKEELAKGRFTTLAEQTKQLLAAGKALTSRQISNALGVERSSITAPIKQLETAGEIVIAYLAKCPTKGKKVRHYKLAGQHD